jgi:hypothetical protein
VEGTERLSLFLPYFEVSRSTATDHHHDRQKVKVTDEGISNIHNAVNPF